MTPNTTPVPYTPTPWHRNVSPAWKYPIYAEIGHRDHAYVGSVVGADRSHPSTTDEQVEGNLDLIVASVNSYAKHCGPNAIQCAEDDLLDQALDALREYVSLDDNEDPTTHDYMTRSYDLVQRARDILSRLSH